MEGLNVLRGLGATRRLDGSSPTDEAAYLLYIEGEEEPEEFSTTEIDCSSIPIDRRSILHKIPYPPRSKVRRSSKSLGVACQVCGFADGIEMEIETVTTRIFTMEDDGRYHENPFLPRHYEETITYLCGNCHTVLKDSDVTVNARFVCEATRRLQK